MSNNYPWKIIDPKDFIQIEATDSFTLKDVHVLTRLYQPLIGTAAYALYSSLVSDVDFQAKTRQVTISELLTKLDIGIPDFYHARIRLEGIGLLRIYRSHAEPRDYIYEVVAPLSAEGFFKDSLLRTLLVEKIGERLFQAQLDDLLYEPSQKQAYEETTRSFLDVYHVDFQNSQALTQTDFMPMDTPKRPRLAQTIENTDSFDYTFFTAGLDSHFIKKDSLTSEVKELIYTFHVVYGIDEMTMQTLMLESADVESGMIDKNKLAQNVQRNFTNKQKTKTNPEPPREMTETVEVDDRGFSDAEKSIISHAKQTPPADYLSSIKEQKGGFVTSNEQWVLKELVEQSPLSTEVINILMNYILIIKSRPMLDKNYTMTIANDWAQSDVKLAEDAMTKLKDIYMQPKKAAPRAKTNYSNRYQNKKPDEKLPDWANEEKKPKPKTDELVSQEESASMQERLEQLRKLRQQKEDN